MEAAYARYKTDFARRGVTSFFDKMKDASWFREKYDPGKEYEDMRERLKRRGREGQVQRFLDEFESGAYDHLTHELGEFGQAPLFAPSLPCADGSLRSTERTKDEW